MENKNNVKSISALGAFALSIGTAIGWGSFVVTGSSFVSKAGPLGSIIGLIIGMLIMCVVAYNYHYMMKKYPESNGGIYSFAKHTLGGDHAFLIAWFLIITYAAILWANVSSFSLFARYIFGDVFQFGFHYSIGGYDVWLGEILLSTSFLCLFGGICLLKKKITVRIQIVMALLFIAVLIAGFIIAAVMHQGGIQSYKPDFALTGENKFSQVIRVIGMTPWAYIGFESISHSSKNFKFSQNKTLKVLIASIVVSTLIYILLCQLCISVFPNQYSNWYEYLNSSESLGGLDAIPAFYVMHRYIGVPGVVLFGVALFAIIATSLIGNIYALCGLCHSMSEDQILPGILGKKDKNDNSRNTIIVLVILAFLMLFFGRILIGWIVDINNICGLIIYTYISVITIYQAKKDRNRQGKVFGIIGLVFGIIFALSLMVLSIVDIDWIGQQSIAIFFIWATIGFIYYAHLVKRDNKKVFGHSLAAEFGLYALIIYSIGTWLAILVQKYHDTNITVAGIIVCMFIAIVSQAVFFVIFTTIRKREIEVQNKLEYGMAQMVEGRDNSTGGHIKRTSKVAELIVNEMIKDSTLFLNHRFFSSIIKAAPMHDIGKITVDDAILRKPGKYTPEEFAVMKKHAAAGATILEDILKDSSDEDFEKVAINVAHYHHERWDGSGYPCGLKEEEIPLEARIMAIADVYDALVSKRVYKEEFSFEMADKIIMEGFGKQFDPGLEKYYLAARSKIEEYYSNNK